MWLLEHEGDFFQKNKIWLRPGKSYLFGRTGNTRGQRLFQITSKSVSRQHLVIEIGNVEPGNATQVQTRSQITLKDESKFGTSVDGNKFNNNKFILPGKEHRIQLGNWTEGFLIKWRPVCLTLSTTEKQSKNGEDLLSAASERVEQLDIKIVLPYLLQHTTHVVSSKRNVAKGLQALVNARYLVTDKFLDAIETSARSPGFEDDGETPLPAPLEQDFAKNWPNELHYLPPQGKEPNPRPEHFFAPNASRISIFEGFDFVFGDNSQYESLSAALLNGGAKCFKYIIEPHKTAVEDFVRYVNGVAEEKGLDALTSRNGRGIVVVRSKGKGAEEVQWHMEFLEEVDRQLGQHSIQQNEFLDAILTNDTSTLKRPLYGPSSSMSQSVRLDSPSAPSYEAVHEEQQRRPVSNMNDSRAATKSRFKGFDNDDDDEQDEKEDDQSGIPDTNQDIRLAFEKPNNVSRHSAHSSGREQDSGLFVTESQTNVRSAATAERNPLKRVAPSEDLELREASLFPGATAMRKRRFVDDQDNEVRPGLVEVATSHPGPDNGKGKETRPSVDVKAAAKTFAKQSDRPDYDEEDDDDKIDIEQVVQMRDLVIEEDMDISGSYARPSRSEPSTSQWAGRPNFKQFRRSGQGPSVNHRGHRIIVGLEEVRPNSLVMNEDVHSMSNHFHSRSTRDYHSVEHEESPEANTGQVADDQTLASPQDIQSHGTDTFANETGRNKRKLDSDQQRTQSEPKRSRRWNARAEGSDSSSSSDDGDELGIRFRRRKRK